MENIKIENPYLDLNTMDKPTLLVLAAGLGSRYKGQKQVDALTKEGETLMEFALYDALKVGIKKIVFVINDQFPSAYRTHLEEVLKSQGGEVHFVEQTVQSFIPETYYPKLKQRKKPLGTAHAVYCAKAVIDEPFITMNADDFYGAQTFKAAVDSITNGDITATNFGMVAFELKNTLSDNGSVSRGLCQVENYGLKKVEEFTKIEKTTGQVKGLNEALQEKVIDENAQVSMNFWVLHPSFFKMAEQALIDFFETHDDLGKTECYLPTVIDNNIQNGNLSVKVLPTNEQWFGLTYPGDRERVVAKIANQKDEKEYPMQLWGVNVK